MPIGIMAYIINEYKIFQNCRLKRPFDRLSSVFTILPFLYPQKKIEYNKLLKIQCSKFMNQKVKF